MRWVVLVCLVTAGCADPNAELKADLNDARIDCYNGDNFACARMQGYRSELSSRQTQDAIAGAVLLGAGLGMMSAPAPAYIPPQPTYGSCYTSGPNTNCTFQ